MAGERLALASMPIAEVVRDFRTRRYAEILLYIPLEGNGEPQSQEKIRELHEKIGKLGVENAFLDRALGRFPGPSGKRSSSEDWHEVLKATGCQISMDGRARWIDNILIERLWRSVRIAAATKYSNGYRFIYRVRSKSPLTQIRL
jgi:hypothetical protein